MIRGRTLVGALSLAAALMLGPRAAHGWDPSTTHQGLLENAVLRSALHLRWMEASELQRGLFSSLRVTPDALDPELSRILQRAQRRAHADSGARALGGPGACPGANAPASTQLFCVRGDDWELSALGWLRLGMLAEVSPPSRHIHHFLDRANIERDSWSDRELPPQLLRSRQSRSNGEPVAGIFTATNFAGDAPSALAWLEDARDPLAPPALFAHLENASLARSPQAREQHRAMALVCTGALLHVLQDLTVPAHARGDASAFFNPLSNVPGDRGLPLQEIVREEYGRSDLPLSTLGEPNRGLPEASTLRGLVLGEGAWEGAGRFTATHFFSESSLPDPQWLSEEMSAGEAASRLLGADSGLGDEETEGAVLSPWPAPRGYVRTRTGRALAAFDEGPDGQTELFLDRAVFRAQAAHLLPMAVRVSRSAIDLIWAGFPTTRTSAGGAIVEIDVGDLVDPMLIVLRESASGDRTRIDSVKLRPSETNRVVGLPTSEGARGVLVLRWTDATGRRRIAERTVPRGEG